MFHELPPAEDGIGAQRIEPFNQPNVAALLALAQHRPEGASRFAGIPTLLDGFRQVRPQFFIDLAAHAVHPKHFDQARPSRHVTRPPDAERQIYSDV